jgi:hypothetical protein
VSAAREAAVERSRRSTSKAPLSGLVTLLAITVSGVLSGAVEAWAGDSLAIEAEQLVMEEGLWRGVGAVHLRLGSVLLEGEEALWDSESGRLEMSQGSFRNAEGFDLRFEGLVWQDERFVFSAPSWIDLASGLRAQGATLERGPSGALEGEDFQLDCDCSGPSPWLVRARQVRWDEEGVLALKGARVGLLGTSFLPLPPVRLPLSRRSGLLIPELGYGIDGLRLKTPLFLTLGDSADLTLSPELRTGRGVRLLAEQRVALRDGEGRFTGAAGYDWMRAQPRGGGRWTFGWSRARWNMATVGQLRSDAAYLSDYGDRFLARQTPWTESRSLLGWRQVEVWSDVFQSERAVTQELGVLVARLPVTEAPMDSLIEAEVLGAVRGVGANPWEVRDAAFSGSAQVGLERPQVVGPLLVRPALWGRASRYQAGVDAEALGLLELRLLGWSNARGYTRVEPGLSLEGELTAAGIQEVIRPQLHLRRVGEGGQLWDVRLGARFAEGAPTLDGWLGMSQGGFTWWGHGRSAAEGAAETASGLSLGAGALEGNLLWAWTTAPERESPFHQGRASVDWRLPGKLSTVNLRGGLGLELTEAEALSRHGGLSYTHPSGCLALGVDGWFDADREFPDVMARVHFLPGRR